MTPEEAYIEGFVKRASEYGYNKLGVIELLKNASEQGSDMDKLIQKIKAQHAVDMSHVHGLDTTTNSMIDSINGMLQHKPQHIAPNPAALDRPNLGFLSRLKAFLSRRK